MDLNGITRVVRNLSIAFGWCTDCVTSISERFLKSEIWDPTHLRSTGYYQRVGIRAIRYDDGVRRMLTVYTFGDSILDCGNYNGYALEPGRLPYPVALTAQRLE